LVDSSAWVLHANDVVAGYGNKAVIRGVSIDLGAGEIVALIGHNGVGKSTLLKAVFGLIPLMSGTVKINGREVTPSPNRLVHMGIGYVAQGHRIFTELSVLENLRVAANVVKYDRRDARFDKVLGTFTALRTRMNQRAGTLSGGEQQMLAMANCLLSEPRAILVDEPSLGLGTTVVENMFVLLKELSQMGTAILIVEQRIREVICLAHRFYLLKEGSVAFSGLTKEVNDESLRRMYL